MTTLYWDCFSGIAGNMAVASLLDLGASRQKLLDGLKSIPFEEGPIELIIEERLIDGIRGLYFNTVDDEHSHEHNHEHAHEHHEHDGPLMHSHCHETYDNHDHHEHPHTGCQVDEHIHHGPLHEHEPHEHHHHDHAPHRGLTEIGQLIDRAAISDGARRIAKECFRVLGEAEATIHGKSLSEVHFHEVGARDSIADIVGVAICLDDLKVSEVRVSPVHLGSGMVKCAHGSMPVPAPATALLLKGLPVVFDHHLKFELTTPTGAAILCGVRASQVEGQQTYDKVGHGHGSLKIGQANFLRAFLSESDQVKKNSDSVVFFATNIDNATGEELGHAVSELMKAGAVDACLVPLLMKKGRPGHQLQVMATLEAAEAVEQKIFELLPTIGVRRSIVERSVLEREKVMIDSDFGQLAGKTVHQKDGSSRTTVEFDELVKTAQQQNTTPRQIKQKIVV